MSSTPSSRWTFRGIIEAPVERVWEALLTTSPLLAHVDPRSLTEGPDQQQLTTTFGEPPVARIHVQIDRRAHSLATEGEWWYRGVYAVEPHDRGCLIEYRVYNIAPRGSRWLVPFVTRNNESVMAASFQELLRGISERLHCSARVIAGASHD